MNTLHTETVYLAEFCGMKSDNVENLKKYFSDVRIMTEAKELFEGDRKGWRMHDYWQAKNILSADNIGIAFDGDMTIVSDKVKDIIPLVKKFGICLPANPRYLVGIDADIGADGGEIEIGTGYAMNCGIIALDTSNKRAVKLVEKYCELMLKKPERGTLVWWRAMWETGITPCLLPPQWCVCREDIGIGNEIILHTGHSKVTKYYDKN